MKFADLLTLGFVLSCVLPLASTACAAESGEDSSSVPPVLPMENFFRNPEVGAFSLSPDGAKLAFVKPWERRMNVYVRDMLCRSALSEYDLEDREIYLVYG